MSRHRRQPSQALPLGFNVMEESSKASNVGLDNVGASGSAAAADGIDSKASAKTTASAPPEKQRPCVSSPTMGSKPSKGTTEKH